MNLEVLVALTDQKDMMDPVALVVLVVLEVPMDLEDWVDLAKTLPTSKTSCRNSLICCVRFPLH